MWPITTVRCHWLPRKQFNLKSLRIQVLVRTWGHLTSHTHQCKGKRCNHRGNSFLQRYPYACWEFQPFHSQGLRRVKADTLQGCVHQPSQQLCLWQAQTGAHPDAHQQVSGWRNTGSSRAWNTLPQWMRESLMTESQNNYAEWEKPDNNEYTLCGAL